jgi:thymidylate synthase (FAD)
MILKEKKMSEMIEVLDNGYVRLVDVMGSDLSVVNAARASFAKESDELTEADERLIKFLVRENHMSPFRHAFMSFEFKAPLMVARQHWKYIVGSDHAMDGWNESSRRYVTQDPEFYTPDIWRSAPEHKKQGSGAPVSDSLQFSLSEDLIRYYSEGVTLYEQAMADGVAAEQARLFLPAYGMYVNYRWSASLQSVMLFLNQRLAEDSQVEIQEYAKAVKELVKDKFPISMELLVG